MARITETELERLKKETSLRGLVEASGVQLKKSGKDWVGCCPFHEDSTASLNVSESKNLFHCFGCGAAGGVIDWAMKIHGISFRHAVELLRNDLSLAAGMAADVVKQSTVPLLPTPVSLDGDEQSALDQVIDYYHATLKNSPNALEYLASRGLTHPEMIETFKLGYANRTLGLRLPERTRKAGEEIRSRLEKVGIYRQSGHEHFSGSLVIPVLDKAGHVREVYGRKLIDKLRPGTPMHLYLPGQHAGVWNESGLAASGGEVILCEALIDALTFWCAGYRNVTASYGVEGFTEDHLAAFKQYGIKRVLIAYDRDEAGERGANKLTEQLISEGFECARIQFPKGMDANEYALKVTPAEQSLGLLIRSAAWLGKGVAPIETIACAAELAPSSLAAASDVAELNVQVSEDEVVISLGDRRYRIRGLGKNLSYETLKVNVLVSKGEAYYVDTFDIYAARHRHHYIQQAAKELALREEIIKVDIGKVLLKLEVLQDERIRGALKTVPDTPKMSEAEQKEALALLKTPDLLSRVLSDFERCGLVGESTNKLVGYLAAVSRKLDSPLAVVIQSSSAAGKSSLMDAVLAFVPEEERIKYSAMTGQSLFYMGETNLKHKILAICEEEGASRASYALKLLQSEGELTIASTGKDPHTGNLITQPYRVEGPVMIMLTTTAIEMDEELLNRCLVLSVDEGRVQTEAIHVKQRQKRTLEGLQAKRNKQDVLKIHQNAQRLLRPLFVVNPYADHLTFLSDKTRTRRDHEKYLTLIDSIALLHQYQRTIKTIHRHGEKLEYIEATLEDIEYANALAHEVLGRSLDELTPQTRRLLILIDEMVKTLEQEQALPRSEIRFSRKAIRDYCGWSDFQVKSHVQKLTEMEYLLAHRGGRGQSFEYELLYDGDRSGSLHLSGLLDTCTIKNAYDSKKEHPNLSKEVSRSIQGGAKEHGCRFPQEASQIRDIKPNNDEVLKNAYLDKIKQAASYHSDSASEEYGVIPLAAKGLQ
jgi:DNA primase catalytic core